MATHQQAPKQYGSNTNWMLPTVPSNIALGPLSTLIPLYILQLGGGVLDVSYAITLSSAIAIPAVFLWGYITDFLDKRKLMIATAYLGSALLLGALFFIKSIVGVIFVYALIAYISAATTTPLNLLVMETASREKWAHNFARLQMLIGLGSTLGLIIASIITGFTSLSNLILVLAFSGLLSFLLAMKLVEEPKNIAKSISLSAGIHSFIMRLAGTPMMLIRIPHIPKLRHVFKFQGIRGLERSFIIRFYIISFIFYLGSSIFNTEYPVGLKFSNLTESSIFFITLIAMGVQTLIFYYYDFFAKDGNKKYISYASLFVRGLCYFAIGAVFFAFTGILFSVANLILFSIASGVTYSIYYTTSYAIFFNSITGRARGSTVGIYSTLAGIGTFGGALLSGALVLTSGFATTFIIAGFSMLVCAGLFKALPKIR